MTSLWKGIDVTAIQGKSVEIDNGAILRGLILKVVAHEEHTIFVISNVSRLIIRPGHSQWVLIDQPTVEIRVTVEPRRYCEQILFFNDDSFDLIRIYL